MTCGFRLQFMKSVRRVCSGVLHGGGGKTSARCERVRWAQFRRIVAMGFLCTVIEKAITAVITIAGVVEP